MTFLKPKRLFVLLMLLVFFSISTGAEEPKKPPRVAAPIWYEDLMLILSDREGVAAIVFKNDFVSGNTKSPNDGAVYRFRYLRNGSKSEKKGEGMVREKYKLKPVGKPEGKMFEKVEDESRLFIEAGSIKIEWSHCTKGRGWIYYFPEQVSVEIGVAKEFSDIDLKRFRWKR